MQTRVRTEEALPRVGEPRLVDRRERRVVVARTRGNPAAAARTVVPALYRAVYTLKLQRRRSGRDFELESLRARWAGAHGTPRSSWQGEWALPVPDDVESLPASDVPLELATWSYGTCAEILHEGSHDAEGESMRRLHALVDELGYVVAGPHEEEYLTAPAAGRPRTLIRCAVRRRR